MSDSGALHARVRAFARASLEGAPPPESFERLALAIARFQARESDVASALSEGEPASLEAVACVPADAFRRGRVACHPADRDVARFATSGTTGGAGVHPFRTLETYRELSVAWGARALLAGSPSAAPSPQRVSVVALAPPFESDGRSSLGYMMQAFMAELDGRGLTAASFDPGESARWLLRPGGVDVEGLRSAIRIAERRGEPLLVLATAFALAFLLRDASGARLPLPSGSTVMITGGFKGHQVSLDEAELQAAVIETFALDPSRLVGEYGMTELSSQLYDAGHREGEPRVYLEPPWLRVVPVDPITLSPVAPGEPGLACFTDLANVDSALRVLTRDRVRRQGPGIVLIGRRPGARLRGCSLSAEALGRRGLPAPASPRPSPASRPGRAETSGSAEPPRAFACVGSGVELQRSRLLLEAAARLVRTPQAAWKRELAQSCRLSPEGVDWALSEVLGKTLERPDWGALGEAAARAPRAPRAHVALPAHVFVEAPRAIALALASAERVLVKPSRREPVFARELARAAPDLFELGDALRAEPGDHVWLYGSDESAEALLDALPEGAILHAHGSGFGVAALGAATPLADAELGELARALAADVVAFDQRGCLSPRLVLVEADAALARRFQLALARALSELEARVPRGPLDAAERAEIVWAERCLRAVGDVRQAGQGFVALSVPSAVAASFVGDVAPRPPSVEDLPPIGRNLEVVVVGSLAQALSTLEPWLTSVAGSDDATRDVARRAASRARVCPFGEMQRPPLDGPVDRRTDPRGVRVARRP